MRDLTHDEARLRLQFRLDGRLSGEEGRQLAAHLEACHECRAEAAAGASLVALWRERDLVIPPADLTVRIMASVVEAPPARRPTILAPLFAASGGVLLLLAWFLGDLVSSASALLEGLVNAAAVFWADPLAVWSTTPNWAGASIPIAVEVLLTAGLGLLLISAAGLLALPLSSVSGGRLLARGHAR